MKVKKLLNVAIVVSFFCAVNFVAAGKKIKKVSNERVTEIVFVDDEKIKPIAMHLITGCFFNKNKNNRKFHFVFLKRQRKGIVLKAFLKTGSKYCTELISYKEGNDLQLSQLFNELNKVLKEKNITNYQILTDYDKFLSEYKLDEQKNIECELDEEFWEEVYENEIDINTSKEQGFNLYKSKKD